MLTVFLAFLLPFASMFTSDILRNLTCSIDDATNIGHAYGILVTFFVSHLPDIKMSGYIINHAYGI